MKRIFGPTIYSMIVGRVVLALLLAGLGFAATEEEGCETLPASAPEHINALANTGLSLSRAGKYQVAAKCYRKVLAIDPNIAPIQVNLGLAEFKSGSFRDAIPPLKSAVELDPENFQALTMLGMTYFGARMYKEAAETLEQSLAKQPDNVQLRFNLAQSLVFSGQYERALT
ncbi:MAG TPA: tetratricopeptide repeat protein [Bryobacteraceae bacterium]|nr:tetratricopeptide repeat protein [Bryobacteraceae bacterium]